MFSFRYTSKGFLPVYIPNKAIENVELIQFLGDNTIKKHPELADWQTDIPTSKNI